MESGGFFNAEQLSDGSYDINYVAEQFAQYFALFVGNGIFVDNVNNLQASAAGNMNVKFNKGAAFWDGYWYINSEDLVKVVDLNLDASARIDSFVVRFDIAGRKNKIEYKKGDTTVQRADGIYELQLCTVRVDAGASSITNSNITDMRTDENVCGFVKGLLEVVQTSDLFKQFSDMFNTWFDNIRGVLDGDAAGNIVGMIGSLNDLQTTNKDNIVGAVNELNSDVIELNKNMGGLSFGKDGDGNYGYYGADGSLIPFSSFGGFDFLSIYCAGNIKNTTAAGFSGFRVTEDHLKKYAGYLSIAHVTFENGNRGGISEASSLGDVIYESHYDPYNGNKNAIAYIGVYYRDDVAVGDSFGLSYTGHVTYVLLGVKSKVITGSSDNSGTDAIEIPSAEGVAF